MGTKEDVAVGHARLIARLTAVAELGEAERRALAAVPMSVRQVAAGEDIVREGDLTHESCVVIDGFLRRYKDLPGGGRQTLAFHIPGDIPDLQSLHLPRLDHTLAAVTAGAVGLLPHAALQAAADAHPAIGRALWREGLIDAARFREWIVNLGGRSALARLAHLFCELYVRSRAIGLAEANECAMPLTQEKLAEALGLSGVHVNRMAISLRERGLIALERRRLRILDWPGLQEVAEFDPAYLHLREDG